MHRLVAFILTVALAVLSGPRAVWTGDDATETARLRAETTSCCGENCACGDECGCCVSAPDAPMRPMHHVTAVTSAVEIRVAPVSPPLTAVVASATPRQDVRRALPARRACNGRFVRRMTCTFLT